MLPVCVGLLIPFGSMRRTKWSLVRDAWTSVLWRASFRVLETELLEQLNVGRVIEDYHRMVNVSFVKVQKNQRQNDKKVRFAN